MGKDGRLGAVAPRDRKGVIIVVRGVDPITGGQGAAGKSLPLNANEYWSGANNPSLFSRTNSRLGDSFMSRAQPFPAAELFLLLLSLPGSVDSSFYSHSMVAGGLVLMS